MLKASYYGKESMNLFSVKNRATLLLADKIEEATSNNTHLSEKDFKELQNYINEIFIARFLKDSNFSVFISPEVRTIASFTSSKNYALETRVLKLDSAINVAAFKNWMDTYVIPIIISKYKGNAFVDQLRPLATTIMENGKPKSITGWKFPFNLADADKSTTTQTLYGKMIEGFNKIAKQDANIFGQNIGDLFYVYNMIVNKDSFGQTSFTKIFEDIVQNDPNSIVNTYNDYISKLDDIIISLDDLGASVNEAIDYIAANNEDSQLSSHKVFDFGPDFTLKLNSFYDMPSYKVVDTIATIETKQPAYKYTLDGQAVVVEMVKQLSKRLPESEIYLITDDDLVNFKDSEQYEDISKSKAFIYNGNIYINVTRYQNVPASGLIHEFAHLVMAGMKFDPKNKDIYYQMISSVKNHPEFNEIAKLYPNHVGSDLYEEVFANLLENYLANKVYSSLEESDNQNFVFSGFMLNNKEAILTAVSNLLGLHEPISKLKDIIGQPIETILDKFGYNLLNSNIQISKTSILDSQKQNTIKQELYNNNKLTMKCDG